MHYKGITNTLTQYNLQNLVALSWCHTGQFLSSTEQIAGNLLSFQLFGSWLVLPGRVESSTTPQEPTQILQTIKMAALDANTRSADASHLFIWNSLFLHLLLERVRAFTMLWDHTNELFMKTTLKRSKWELVKGELLHEFPELAVAGVTTNKCL